MLFRFDGWILVFTLAIYLHRSASSFSLPVFEGDNYSSRICSTRTSTCACNCNDSPNVTTARVGDLNPKLLVILLGGFRWDYITRTDPRYTSSFTRMNEMGFTTGHLEPVVPTTFLPNHQSLLTGLYPEKHGMIMSYMYDEKRDAIFDMLESKNSGQAFWWNESVPIWMEATEANLRTYLYDWPGCDVIFNETVKPNYCKPYELGTKLNSFREHTCDIVTKFVDDNADFGLIYVDHADIVGHNYGPESMTMTMAIRDIDGELNDFITMLEDYTLEKTVITQVSMTPHNTTKQVKMKKTRTFYSTKTKVNVLVVSDHGMTTTDKKKIHHISLNTTLNLDDIQFIIGEGAAVGVYPVVDKIDQVYKDLLKMSHAINVWKKDNIPGGFHLNNHDRIPSIFVLAKKGYFIEPIINSEKQIPRTKERNAKTHRHRGYHGYDPNEVDDMRGIFYAFGYSFKRHTKLTHIYTVDIYNLIAELLFLKPHPNNGSWNNITMYLTSAASSGFSCNLMHGIIVMCLLKLVWRLT